MRLRCTFEHFWAVFRIHIILIWIRFRIRIRGNFWFCESDFPWVILKLKMYISVNIKLLKIKLKNFRHVNNTFTNHFDLLIPWFWLIFGATRIHINVSWSGSGTLVIDFKTFTYNSLWYNHFLCQLTHSQIQTFDSIKAMD